MKNELKELEDFFWTQDVVEGLDEDDCKSLARKLCEAGYRLPEQTDKRRLAVAMKLAMQDVKGRSDYTGKTECQVWENVKAEGLDVEYLEDADQIILSLFPEKFEVLSDEEIINIIFKPGERTSIDQARQLSQATVDKNTGR